MDKINPQEKIFKCNTDNGTYYILETTYNVNTEDETFVTDILDSKFNKLAMQLGRRYKLVADDRLNELKTAGKDVFLGKASPISVICDSIKLNYDLDELRAIWERPTREQVIHYKSLLGLPIERIEKIENDGKQFYAYYDGKSFYDEDESGKEINGEGPTILDDSFNIHYMDVNKEQAEDLKTKLLLVGKPAFIGPHSPVKLVYDREDKREIYVPNDDPNTVGIWFVTFIEEKAEYQELLDVQKKNKALGLNLVPEDK